MSGTVVYITEFVGVIVLLAVVIFSGLEAMSKPRTASVAQKSRRTAPNATRGSL